MKKVRITITVPGATPSQLESVKAWVMRQGVEVNSVLEMGNIFGKVDESRYAPEEWKRSLKLDAGVEASFELEGTVQIAPPNAPVQ